MLNLGTLAAADVPPVRLDRADAQKVQVKRVYTGLSLAHSYGVGWAHVMPT